jgi:hypothetical protein
MVQIIDENKKPSFLQRLNVGVGQGLQQAQQLMQRKQENEQIKKEFGVDLEGIEDPDLRKNILIQNLQGKKENDKKIAQLEGNRSILSDLEKRNGLPEGSLDAYVNDPKMAEKVIRPKKSEKKDDSAEIKNTAQTSFNEMASLYKSGNLGIGSGVKGTLFGGKYAKDPAKFKTLTGGLEAMLVDMVSRGTLSNARFRYITEDLLPKPTDRDAEIEGKMEALADILGLDKSSLGINSNKPGVAEVGSKERKPLTSFKR